jgi:hypothetical protein
MRRGATVFNTVYCRVGPISEEDFLNDLKLEFPVKHFAIVSALGGSQVMAMEIVLVSSDDGRYERVCALEITRRSIAVNQTQGALKYA